MVREPETLNQLLGTISRFVRDRLVPAEADVAEEDAIRGDIVEEMKARVLSPLWKCWTGAACISVP